MITGGTGYLGKKICDKLDTTSAPVVYSSKELDLLHGAIDLDLFVQEHSITHIIHLATSHDFGKNSGVGATITMLKNVLDVCTSNAVKLIFPSTVEVFSNDSEFLIFANESQQLAARTTQGQTKLLCESLIRSYVEQGLLETLILRLPAVYGGKERRPKFLHNLIENILNKDEITIHRYKNGDALVDLLHIEDVCDAMVAAVNKNISGLIHLGTGTPITTRNIVDLVNKLTGETCIVKDCFINTCMANVALSNDYACSYINWHPCISYEKGLSRIILDKQKFL